MKLIIEDEQGRRTPINLSRDELTIGRDESSTICLKERNVSRKHARIFRQGDDVLVEDSSRYGSKLNGRRFTGTVKLRAGDIAEVGGYKLSLSSEAETKVSSPSGPPRLVPRAIVTYGPPRLLARSRGLEARCWFIADDMVLGSDPRCDIVIERPNVVGRHIRIIEEEEGWRIVQHENGTFFQVNGELKDEHELSRGDKIRVGDAELLFIDEDELHVGYPARNMTAMRQHYERFVRWKNTAMVLFGLVIVAACTAVFLSAPS